MIQLEIMHAPESLMPWITQEFNSYVDMEVSYIFCKVPTRIWLLVNVRTFLQYLYTLRAMLITSPSNGIDWCFQEIANLENISCEPLLNQYT